jgi:N-acetylglucosaminyldiphosphoundecaprenol N-acetyl-beta-D-mannosaminyltransferase
MQKRGLEWLFRLTQEPKRLWKRYLVYNTIYLWLFAKTSIRRLFSRQERHLA